MSQSGMSPLQGKIVFRINLDEASTEIAASRKRQREQNEIPSIGKDDDVTSVTPWSGFTLVTTGHHPQDIYLLSVPHALLQQVSQAAAFNLDVVITRYTLVQFRERGKGLPVALVEIFTNGFSLLTTPISSALTSTDDFWTLSHFHQVEGKKRKEKTKFRSTDMHNIIGTVDAVSPIIALDPKDPFCLVELYDQDNPAKSCVLILNGSHALLWQPAIQTGDTLRLQGLRRKMWRVPTVLNLKPAFQHFHRRIPSFVFVFGEFSRIVWTNTYLVQFPVVNHPIPFPPTAWPLISLQGIVRRVEQESTKHGRNQRIKIIQWIDLECDSDQKDDGPKRIVRLFVSHFPMAMDIQLSLQINSIVRAVNIHPIITGPEQLPNEYPSFGACLRSTLTIVCTAREHEYYLEQHHNDDESDILQQDPQQNDILSKERRSMKDFVSYRLGKIKNSYRIMAFFCHARKWLEDGFVVDTTRDRTFLPTMDDLLGYANSLTIETNATNAIATSHPVKASSSTTRNPYAEFFDHAFDGDFSADRNPNSSGCHCTQDETENATFPYLLLALNDIRMASLRILGPRLASIVQRQPMTKGWSGSIHLSKTELLQELTGNVDESCNTVVIGGFANRTSTSNGEVLALSDRTCQLCLRFVDSGVAMDGEAFVLGCLQTVIISCFCLIMPKNESSMQSPQDLTINAQALPPLNKTHCDGVMGGGAVVRLGSFIFVVSVQLICSQQQTHFGKEKCKEPRNQIDHLNHLDRCTIQECLLSPNHWKNSSGTIEGALIRSRLRLAKCNAQGFSKCLILTIADFTAGDTDTRSPSFLQSIELTVAVPRTTSQVIAFKRVLKSIASADIVVLDDDCSLGLSWWTIAENCQTSPLVSGGWDEYCGGTDAACSTVIVTFPSDSIITVDRGYVRWSCPLDSLGCRFGKIKSSTRINTSVIQDMFHFIGGAKFFDGMLCRRPYRRRLYTLESGHYLGELQSIADFSHDLPRCTLVDLIGLTCKAIRTGDSGTLSPSLVRRIHGANFLGIGYCSAQCKCSSCFEALVDTTIDEDGKSDDEIGDVWERSFWHCPAPGDDHYNNGIRRYDDRIAKSRLRCPNKCGLEHYSILWQCSGILDDGTGQAKVYAEREMALTLLSLPSMTRDDIESGLWQSRSGLICYSKSIPPTSHLRNQVERAMSIARTLGKNPLLFLPPSTRAEYHMMYHCRNSILPNRKLDYFVKCKPLADGITHLNHTTVQSFLVPSTNPMLKSWSEVATYSLPPLKLQLVDSMVPGYL